MAVPNELPLASETVTVLPASAVPTTAVSVDELTVGASGATVSEVDPSITILIVAVFPVIVPSLAV